MRSHSPKQGGFPPGIATMVSALMFLLGVTASPAQVSPAEILNPQLQELEKTYFAQLKSLNGVIAATKFPFSFHLSRYTGLDPKEQAGSDTRGVEFVHFQNRNILKISGNYNAAYNAEKLTPNERASRVFEEAILPLLAGVAREIPPDVACDAIGFEISYHARRAVKNYDFEGKERLVVVFDRADAFSFLETREKQARQDILNHSQVFLDGQEFGLALGGREALSPEELQHSNAQPSQAPAVSSATAAGNSSALLLPNPRLLADTSSRAVIPPGTPGAARSPGITPGSDAPEKADTAENSPPPALTPAAAEQLQSKYQKQLDSLAKEGQAKFHFVDYAPPSFVIFQNRAVLQLTVRNTIRFAPGTSSIYKRTAQTFDLFLAPQLKDILDRISSEVEFDGLDISVLNAVKSAPGSSSEAIEFVCPLKALHRFTAAEITNQELINQSVVLVNGVRIALNLQLVE